MNCIKEYYEANATQELERLNNPYSQIEFATTTHLIKKYFLNKGKVLDIGAGPGRYSLELVKMGNDVSLLDLSQNLLDIARKNIEDETGKSCSYHCQSALELESFADGSFDNVLVLGPMYHLHNENDRMKVLNDVHRILKPGGRAIIAYINTWGAMKAAVYEFPESFADVSHFDRYLDGNLKFTKEESFTESYFTTAAHAAAEVSSSKLKVLSSAGAESFLSGMSLEIRALYDSNKDLYNNFLRKAVECCEMEMYKDATEHFLVIAEK